MCSAVRLSSSDSCFGLLYFIQLLSLHDNIDLNTNILQVVLALGDYMNVQCHACIGGKSISEDVRRLDYGVQVRVQNVEAMGEYQNRLILTHILRRLHIETGVSNYPISFTCQSS